MTGTPPEGPTTNTEAVAYPSSRTGTLTFTITPSNSPTPPTLTDVQAFSNTMRYGTNGFTQGNQTKASIEALTEVSGPNESRSQTIYNIPADAGMRLSFAYADILSDVKQVRRNKNNQGFVTASFDAVRTNVNPVVQTSILDVNNSAGFSETFAAITSTDTDMTDGSDDFQLLTSSIPQNYIYWGELAKSSGYTETDVENNIASEPGRVASNSMSSRDMTVNATASEYTYIAYPSRLGALTSIIIGGFESIDDFNIDNTALSITNDGGFQENYRVYVSKNPGFTDPTTMTVTI